MLLQRVRFKPVLPCRKGAVDLKPVVHFGYRPINAVRVIDLPAISAASAGAWDGDSQVVEQLLDFRYFALMDVVAMINGFFQNPDNRWLLVALAVLLWLAAWWLRRVARRSVVIGGDNTGIVVNGNVQGDITQHQRPAGAEEGSASAPTARRCLEMASAISGILSLLVAAATFYWQFLR